MREGHASRTAEHNTLFRALEASRPEGRRHFDEPLARAFLTWPLSLVEKLGRAPGFRAFIPWFIDRRWPGVRTSVVARTRLIDDWITRSLEEPIEQFVVLGAGFDTRAYRLKGLKGLEGLGDVTVFEVDHPATQAAKRQALERALGSLPGHVRFVATDFVQQGLQESMHEAGYREDARTLFLWEGTTNYLTEEAVDATLRWCARSAAEGILIFTYVHSDILTAPERFVGTERLFASLERWSERFTFGIDPGRLREFLAERCFELEDDVGAADYRVRCYGDAARRMVGHEFYRAARARVRSDARSSLQSA
jgi:methyltransferase (TIGR00027 family)